MPSVVLQERPDSKPSQVSRAVLSRSVPTRRDAKRGALIVYELRKRIPPGGRGCFDHLLWGGDERDGQSRLEMPLNVAVEEPRARVVCDETQSYAPHGRNLDGVSTHGICLSLRHGRVQSRIVGRIVRYAVDDLELVPVEMAGSGRRVIVNMGLRRKHLRRAYNG